MGTILEFQNVGYWYKNQDQPLFEEISIQFSQGLLYTIVGTSGSGKTTFYRWQADLMYQKRETSCIKEKTFQKSG